MTHGNRRFRGRDEHSKGEQKDGAFAFRRQAGKMRRRRQISAARRRRSLRTFVPTIAAPGAERARAVDSFFGHFAQRLGLPGGAAVVVGERIEHDGVVVIPVARALWGLGGGVSGGDDAGGGGGGASMKPLGYVHIAGGRARFQRTRSSADLVAIILAGSAGIVVILRALGKLLEQAGRGGV